MTVAQQVKLPRHPAKFSDAVLRALYPYTHPEDRVLDPFAGTGRVHMLNGTTVGVELEPEWAAYHPDTIVGNALHLPFDDASFDVVCTSPCYGNRMADHHNARDKCKPCKGNGVLGLPPGYTRDPESQSLRGVGMRISTDLREYTLSLCKSCGGTGLSRRNTYKAALGHDPSPQSSCTLQWGVEYRAFHAAAWAEATRVLRPGGRFLLNVSDHVRKGRVPSVARWHYEYLLQLGYRHVSMEPIDTPRNRQGENGGARVACEWLFVLEKP